MSLIRISEYNQTYHTHTSCYYCLGLTVLVYYMEGEKMRSEVILQSNEMRGKITKLDFYQTLSLYAQTFCFSSFRAKSAVPSSQATTLFTSTRKCGTQGKKIQIAPRPLQQKTRTHALQKTHISTLQKTQ